MGHRRRLSNLLSARAEAARTPRWHDKYWTDKHGVLTQIECVVSVSNTRDLTSRESDFLEHLRNQLKEIKRHEKEKANEEKKIKNHLEALAKNIYRHQNALNANYGAQG